MSKGHEAKEPRMLKRKSLDPDKRDPYLPDEGPEEAVECRSCGAIHYDKRWSLKKEAPAEILKKTVDKVLCPACRKIHDKYPEGFVTIKGDLVRERRDEIMKLVRNKEERAMHFNPLDRIIDITEHGDRIEITTTTEKLAQRIGQMLHKSFHGEVEYKWSGDVKMARVVVSGGK